MLHLGLNVQFYRNSILPKRHCCDLLVCEWLYLVDFFITYNVAKWMLGGFNYIKQLMLCYLKYQIIYKKSFSNHFIFICFFKKIVVVTSLPIYLYVCQWSMCSSNSLLRLPLLAESAVQSSLLKCRPPERGGYSLACQRLGRRSCARPMISMAELEETVQLNRVEPISSGEQHEGE